MLNYRGREYREHLLNCLSPAVKDKRLNGQEWQMPSRYNSVTEKNTGFFNHTLSVLPLSSALLHPLIWLLLQLLLRMCHGFPKLQNKKCVWV